MRGPPDKEGAANIADDPEHKTVSFRFHPNLIDRLGSGLYDTTGKAMAELVANAHDAHATVVHIRYPKVWSRDEVIVVEDDGDGMSPDDLEQKYLWVAMNRKVGTPGGLPGREPVGELGIGKFAGLGLAERMTLRTRKDGSLTVLTVDRKELDPEDLGKSRLQMEVEPDPERGHGTTLELTRLSEDIVPLGPEQLVEELSYEFSHIPGFSIDVNGEPVAFGFGGKVWETIPIAGEVPGYGDYSGEIIIARRPREVKHPGIVVLARGRRMDGPTLFGRGIRSHGGKMYAYVTGWVEVSWLSPTTAEAQAGKRTPVITGRSTLLKERPGVKTLYNTLEDHLKRAQARVAELLRGETEELLEADKDLMAVFGNPNIPVDKTTKRFMVQIAGDLEEYRPATRVRMVRKLKEHIEVGEQAFIIRAIRAANPGDLESMAALLKDLTLKEVNAVAWEARRRHEAIIQLRRMTAPGIKTAEPVLQQFLEDQPWVLQEGYDRYVSNQRIKERILQEVRHDKPDHLFVRELAGHCVVVEIKKSDQTLNPDHATQALEYRTIVRAQHPEWRVETWLVGARKGDLLSRQIAEDSWPQLVIKTWDEVIDEVEKRYQYILQHLPNEAKWVRDYEPGGEGEPVSEPGVDEEGS